MSEEKSDKKLNRFSTIVEIITNLASYRSKIDKRLSMFAKILRRRAFLFPTAPQGPLFPSAVSEKA